MRRVNLAYKPTPSFSTWLSENGPLSVSQYVAELERAEREGMTERVIDDYDPDTEVTLWHEIKKHSKIGRRFLIGPWQNNTALCFDLQVKMLKQVLRTDGRCGSVIDFGALYAKPAAEIANVFPTVQVYAVDRSERVRHLNESAFPRFSNLHFVASDIFKFMRHGNHHGGCFIHVRTGICMLPKAMEDIYALCARAGIRHIVLIELTGFSHQLRTFYEFGSERRPSAVMRQAMFIHDYPNMLKAAGYRIESADMIKSPMPKPMQQDTHLIAIHATQV